MQAVANMRIAKVAWCKMLVKPLIANDWQLFGQLLPITACYIWTQSARTSESKTQNIS